jgi:ADP-ribose pyrophosphatase YjhB (NUDIX family)
MGVSMDYNLINPKRKSIFQQFLYNKSLRFNEIEKLTGIRSNELAYFLQKMIEGGVLRKDGDVYLLSDIAEKYIPFFIEDSERMSPLPVVLVSCVTEGKVLLWKRKKRPYEGLWGLPGGRIRLTETLSQTSLRLLKEIAYVDAAFESVNAVVNEKNSESGAVKHAFLIIFTRAQLVGEMKDKEHASWFDVSDLPSDMIPSDKWLVQNKLDSVIDYKEETIQQDGEVLGMEFTESNI